VRGLTLYFRSELRRARGAFLLACLIAAIAAGAATTAAAGARRSNSAYPRFLAWSHAADFGTGGADDDATLAADLKTIEGAPFVEASAHVPGIAASIRDRDGRLLPAFQVGAVVDVNNTLASDRLFREKVIRGRHANPEATDEGTVSFSTADRLHVDVGDHVTLVPFDSDQTIDVRIVGVVARAGEFPTLTGAGTHSVALSAGFGRAHPKLLNPGDDGLIVRVRPGTPRAEVEQWLRANLHGTDIEDLEPNTRATNRTIRVETISLWIVAGVLALMFLVLLGQVLLRNTAARAEDLATLRTLGVTRRKLLVLGAMRGAAVGVVAAVGACVIATVASPLTPVGLARLAEPSPGIRVDGTALLVGAAITAVASVALGVLSAWRVSSRYGLHLWRGAVAPLPSAPSPVVAGLHLLVRPARRDSNAPAVTYASLCLVVACATAALLFVTSLSHLRDTPTLAGATWDGVVQPSPSKGENPSSADVERALTGIRSEPSVAAATTGGWVSDHLVNGTETFIQIFGDDGEIKPAIASGRAPSAAGEVAVGEDVMHRLHVGIGDTFTIAAPDGGTSKDVKIVGRSVLIAPIFGTFSQGDAVATTAATMQSFGQPAGLVLVRFRPGVNVDVALADLQEKYGQFSFSSRDKTLRDGIGRINTVPIALLIVLAALALASFVHLHVVSGRRRRMDIAILRTIGFTRRQTAGMIATYAIAAAMVALLVGVPLGLFAGRIGWQRISDYLRVVPEAHLTPSVVLMIGVLVIVGALLTAIGPGARAARVRPAEVFSTDPT
jgi:ABC-type lipoprotein release transport system permease subunit